MANVDLSKVNVIASLKAAGLFNLEKTNMEIIKVSKYLSEKDKQELIDMMAKECPSLIVYKN